MFCGNRLHPRASWSDYWMNFTQISHQGFMLNFVCRICLYVNKTPHERNGTLSLTTSIKELITVTRKMQPGATKLGRICMCVIFTGSNVECRPTSNSLRVYCIVSAGRNSSPMCNLLPCQGFFFSVCEIASEQKRLRRFRLSLQSQLHSDIVKMKVFRSDSWKTSKYQYCHYHSHEWSADTFKIVFMHCVTVYVSGWIRTS